MKKILLTILILLTSCSASPVVKSIECDLSALKKALNAGDQLAILEYAPFLRELPSNKQNDALQSLSQWLQLPYEIIVVSSLEAQVKIQSTGVITLNLGRKDNNSPWKIGNVANYVITIDYVGKKTGP